MLEELGTLRQQDTLKIISLLSKTHVLGCKWVYKIKTHENGLMIRYKAHFIAQDHKQEHGIDYEDTFCPVSKLPFVCILFTIIVHKQWKVFQLDVSNLFLHGIIDTTI